MLSAELFRVWPGVCAFRAARPAVGARLGNFGDGIGLGLDDAQIGFGGIEKLGALGQCILERLERPRILDQPFGALQGCGGVEVLARPGGVR